MMNKKNECKEAIIRCIAQIIVMIDIMIKLMRILIVKFIYFE